jgi:hypothetical protein
MLLDLERFSAYLPIRCLLVVRVCRPRHRCRVYRLMILDRLFERLDYGPMRACLLPAGTLGSILQVPIPISFFQPKCVKG